MKTYKTRAEYLADCTDKAINSHRPPTKRYRWTCADCGAVFADTVSYGICTDSMVCYSCCHARDIHGKHWHGRNSGAGMCILLRASKG